MKIERINENQIKLTLTKSDLSERNIKIEDLTKTNEKTTALFRDIIEKAFEECGFEAENTPLMVEAMPASMDGIMIIVTKLEEGKTSDIDNKINIMKQTKDFNNFSPFKRKPLYNPNSQIKGDDNQLIIYSFDNIDDIINISERVKNKFNGISSLYKYDNRYFILLQNPSNSQKKYDFSNIEDIIGEYGQKHISAVLSKYFLIEHGEKIIENQAIDILCSNFV